MTEKILFCFAFALQIFAWFLAGARFGFRARRSSHGKGQSQGLGMKKPYNTVLVRRLLLVIGAVIVTGYAYMVHDYLLLAGQAVLFVVLWFRVAMEQA